MALDAINTGDISLLGGSFEAMRHDIAAAAEEMRGSLPVDSPRLGVKQDYELRRLASHAVLDVLEELGVEGAAKLAEQLKQDAKENFATDMYTLGHDYETERQFSLTAGPADKIELHRLALLAEAVGGTAHAAVAVTVNGVRDDATLRRMERSRKEVLDYNMAGGFDVAGNALHALLEEVEAVPLDEPPQE